MEVLGSTVLLMSRIWSRVPSKQSEHTPTRGVFIALCSADRMEYFAWSGKQGLKACDAVLTQGTGEASVSAVRFAKAAAAKVVSTASSKEKAELLKQYGADLGINHKEVDKWGYCNERTHPQPRRVHPHHRS